MSRELTAPDLLGNAVASFLAHSDVVHILVAEADGRIRFVSRALATSLHAPAASLVGLQAWSVLAEADAVQLREWMASGSGPSQQVRLLNFVDAARHPFTLRGRVEVGGDGFAFAGEPPVVEDARSHGELARLNSEMAALSRENVRKSRALEKALLELKKAQALLVHQEKMAAVGQMTAGVAHEINNPLAYVLANQETLRRDFDELMAFVNVVGDALGELATAAPGVQGRLLEKAREIQLEILSESIPRKIDANLEGLERVRQLVLDLRIFSRLDEAAWKECDVGQGIESAIRFLGPLARSHGVTVETSLAPLPPFLCSPGELNQAVGNVVANAIQASRPGQRVGVALDEVGGELRIVVEDRGEGIPPENRDRVFDAFFTTKPVGSGTGLGLSIASQVVEGHRGRIEIRSGPGEGTTVTIRLPRGREGGGVIRGAE
jgi:signal transduction histidine kinase